MRIAKQAQATVTVHVPMAFQRRGGRKFICTTGIPDAPEINSNEPIVSALARAHRWRSRIEGGEFSSITELAQAEKVNQSYACRILRLSLLSPEIVERALDGRLPDTLLLKDLLVVLPTTWQRQSDELGLDSPSD